MSINKRCIHILLFILSKDKPVKINHLTEIYKVSERTIRYDLDEIRYWLSKETLGVMEVIYAEGITINCSPDNKERIFAMFEGRIPDDYFYSPEERQKIILLELLNAEQPLKIQILQKKLSISRGTVIKELNIISDWLSKFHLTLVRKPNYGMEVQGEEANKRSALLGIATDFMTTEQILAMIKQQESKTAGYGNPYRKYGIHQDKTLFNIDLDLLEGLLNQLQDLLGTTLSDTAFTNLFTHLAIALQRIKAGKGIYIPFEELILLENTRQFQIAREFSKKLETCFNIPIPKSEIGYITLHILNSDHKQPSGVIPSNTSNPPGYEISNNNLSAKDLLSKGQEINYFQMAKDITGFVKKLLNIEFTDDHQLLIDLSIHLKPTIQRCRYKMFLVNPLLDEIKHRYSRIFLIVKETLLMLKVKYPFEMNEHEISYIALHFAAELEKEKVLYCNHLNVLLVCASGIGTAKMLQNRLNSNFRNLNVVNVVSYLDYCKKEDWNADLVISTINLNSARLPYIVVTPLLNEEDIIKIEDYLQMNTVKNNITPDNSTSGDNATFREQLPDDHESRNVRLLFHAQPKPKSPMSSASSRKTQRELRDVLTPNTILIDAVVKDWEEAFITGAGLLLRQNLIEPCYISALIDTVKNFGPYVVIAPGIALSHAKPENGVLDLGLSMLRLKTPITLGHPENDPVSLLFTLAPIDNFSHHRILTQLMKIFLNKKDMELFFHSNDLQAILSCIACI